MEIVILAGVLGVGFGYLAARRFGIAKAFGLLAIATIAPWVDMSLGLSGKGEDNFGLAMLWYGSIPWIGYFVGVVLYGEFPN